MFGGVREGDLRFCNKQCHTNGVLVKLATSIPAEVLAARVQDVHGGPCPCCGKEGSVDVHTSHRIWSALILTQWNSRVLVSCRSCGIKRKVGDLAFCLVLGWWGFPWGVLGTPIQLFKNAVGIFQSPDASAPSKMLNRIVGLNLAAEFLRKDGARGKLAA